MARTISFCAFCIAYSPVHTAFLPRTSSITPPLPSSLPLPRRRPRRPAHTFRPSSSPSCTFGNNNRNGDAFKSQVADLLVQSGRFIQSGPGQIVLWGGLVWLVLTGRIGFLFDSFLILVAVLSIVPVLAMLGFRWWVNRQLVQGICPSCGTSVTGLKGQSFPCTVCGNTVQGETTGDFSVKDPSSATIDIDAKQVDDY